ncbi:MAG: polymer-forming cytoskeletal protein [Candidatus Zixiibacteriota bacterium]
MKIHVLCANAGFFGAIALGLAWPAGATTYQCGDNVHISPLHEIADDFYTFSDDTRVDGTIIGDLVAISAQTTIKGNILRSANLVGRYGDHNGSVDGSLRFFGDRLSVGGRVGGSVLFLGRKLLVSQGSLVEKDINAAGAEVMIEGNVLGKVTCAAETVRISGQVGGDVSVEGEKIILSPPAVIRGNLLYTTEREDQLTVEPGVTVIGTTTWQDCKTKVDEDEESSVLSEAAYRISALLAAFFFGVIMIGLFRPYAQESMNQLTSRSTTSVAAGLLVGLGLVLAVVVLFLALIGTLLGNILLHGSLAVIGVMLLILSILLIPISSFVTVSGAVVFYTGKVVIALAVGYLVLKGLRPGISRLSKGALLLGLVIISIGVALPYVGPLIYMLVSLVGAGAIILGVRNCQRDKGTAAGNV